MESRQLAAAVGRKEYPREQNGKFMMENEKCGGSSLRLISPQPESLVLSGVETSRRQYLVRVSALI
ncbi:MAG: hypothetical protein EA412_13540 [Chitinophagaceae bacterium]|nr:MAG: hypothetical protein EA412_13540 [Chitinophagaceae bacterium]